MRIRPIGRHVALLGLLTLLPYSTATAFDPLSVLAKPFTAPIELIGGAVGQGLANGARPTIDHTLDRVDATVDRFNVGLADNIDRIEEIVGGVQATTRSFQEQITQTTVKWGEISKAFNVDLRDNIGLMDASLEERIEQLDLTLERNFDQFTTEFDRSTDKFIVKFGEQLKIQNDMFLETFDSILAEATADLSAEFNKAVDRFAGVIGPIAEENLGKKFGELETALSVLDLVRASALAARIAEGGGGSSERYARSMLKTKLFSKAFINLDLRKDDSWAALRGIHEQMEVTLGHKDPDGVAILGYGLWQKARTRSEQHEAACRFANAIELHREMVEARKSTGFILAPLASHYVNAYLQWPLTKSTPSCPLGELHAAIEHSSLGSGNLRGGLDKLIKFNEAVIQLDSTAISAYVQMLDTHNSAIREDPKQPQFTSRTVYARRVTRAWRNFDIALEGSDTLEGSSVTWNAFRLNDAIATRALWWASGKGTISRNPAPALTAPPSGQLDSLDRLRLAPPRLAWEHRWSKERSHSPHGEARAILATLEAERFRAFEELVVMFENSFLQYKASKSVLNAKGAAATNKQREDLLATAGYAIRAAAALNLYVTSEDDPWREAYAYRLERDLFSALAKRDKQNAEMYAKGARTDLLRKVNDLLDQNPIPGIV